MLIARIEYYNDDGIKKFTEIHYLVKKRSTLKSTGEKIVRVIANTGRHGVHSGKKIKISEGNFNADRSTVQSGCESFINDILKHDIIDISGDFVDKTKWDREAKLEIDYKSIWGNFERKMERTGKKLTERQKEFLKEKVEDDGSVILRREIKLEENEYINDKTGERIKYKPFKLSDTQLNICYKQDLEKHKIKLGLIKNKKENSKHKNVKFISRDNEGDIPF